MRFLRTYYAVQERFDCFLHDLVGICRQREFFDVPIDPMAYLVVWERLNEL